ncbi:DUF1071 domain-containing protein [Bacillus thuringiensis]|uniref:DUF1071 domain-containing protein n=1 Tax=Bacillus thuringiensis TaxID=1428 RepID=UPI000BF4CB9A|nr:DUF1071 domain-containing protein [Bacillus thuringiensis]MEB9416633.1 DUF1071 domain-containing protein [Bacillus cereus]MEB9445286.1 DUF1071 domain-containing protein [Bacillus cereus]MED3310322.1 DUF1071 domain-containing protein [Bacillus thuringiensis]PFV77850.1 hypothetical protein COL02_12360 [Bacillus thuringiensis]HDR4948488.1 DUF1071 domain-containing protein [Bacillus cereus]
MSETKNYFAELAVIDVSKHVEKKGRFSYLSWSWAVDQLLKKYPDATWQVVRFDGLPYMKTEVGYFVEVEVTVNNITRSQIHPVLDNYNKPIAKPTSFQINTSIQRCLAKAIALHGLGLYIYSGEDIPHDDEPKQAAKQLDNVPKQEQARQAEVANEQRIKAIHVQIRELSEVYNMSFEETKNTVKQSLGIQSFKGMTVQQASQLQKTITSWLNEAKEKQQQAQ